MPHWGCTPDDVATFLLFRMMYSFREQSRIKNEFEAYQKSAGATTSFAQWFAQRYGSSLNGTTTSFQEVVALFASGLRADFGKFTNMAGNAAKSGRETRDKIEAVATSMRAAGVRPFVGGAAVPQQQQYGMQQYAPQQYSPQQLQQQYSMSYSPPSYPGYGGYGGYGGMPVTAAPPQYQQQPPHSHFSHVPQHIQQQASYQQYLQQQPGAYPPQSQQPPATATPHPLPVSQQEITIDQAVQAAVEVHSSSSKPPAASLS